MNPSHIHQEGTMDRPVGLRMRGKMKMKITIQPGAQYSVGAAILNRPCVGPMAR